MCLNPIIENFNNTVVNKTECFAAKLDLLAEKKTGCCGSDILVGKMFFFVVVTDMVNIANNAFSSQTKSNLFFSEYLYPLELVETLLAYHVHSAVTNVQYCVYVDRITNPA